MKYTFFIISILAAFSFIRCTSARDKMSGEIAKMETDLKSARRVDSASVVVMISAYQNFALKYPGDSLSSEFLYKAAGLSNGFKRGVQAIDIFESIIHTYPGYKRIPECYFMEAFAYENVLGNNAKASEYYTQFLEKYPQHQLADDARAALKFLGKTPDEIVREFERLKVDSVKLGATLKGNEAGD